MGLVMLQEGIVRVKLAKILSGYDDVHYERSIATDENIKLVCIGLIDHVLVISKVFYFHLKHPLLPSSRYISYLLMHFATCRIYQHHAMFVAYNF